jgi:hypothetical protein
MNASLTFAGTLEELAVLFKTLQGGKPEAGKPTPAAVSAPEEEDDDDLTGGGEEEIQITDADLRAKINPIATTKREKVKALLGKFGVQRATELPQEKRADFLKKLEKLA